MGAYKHADQAHWSHPNGHDYSFVIRPTYKWSNFTSTVFEAGYTTQKNTGWNGWANPDNDHVDAYKFTLAQQFSPMTTFWSRPSIRFYVSYLGGDLMNRQYTHFVLRKTASGTATTERFPSVPRLRHGGNLTGA